MLSLAERRLISDEMLLYKLLNNVVSSFTSDQINVLQDSQDILQRFTYPMLNPISNIIQYERKHNHQFLSCNLYEKSQNTFRRQVLDQSITRNIQYREHYYYHN